MYNPEFGYDPETMIMGPGPGTAVYDITEFLAMLDLYAGQKDILGIRAATVREAADAVNPNDEQSDGDRHLPTDLEAMRYRGSPGMNDTFLGYLGSALGKGETVVNAIET